MEKKKVDGGMVFGNLFFLSGMCNIADTVEEEIRMCMEELSETLQKQGADFKNVLKATVFLKNLDDRERCLNDVWKEYFPVDPPARTCVQAGIGKCSVEIDLIAALP